MRFTLTAEARLNDGLAFPFVYLGLIIAAQGSDPSEWLLEWIARDVICRIVVGAVVGALVGWCLGNDPRSPDTPDSASDWSRRCRPARLRDWPGAGRHRHQSACRVTEMIRRTRKRAWVKSLTEAHDVLSGNIRQYVRHLSAQRKLFLD
ncbi:MAG: hypothetical protein R6V26_07955 [Roseovarius sp.]